MWWTLKGYVCVQTLEAVSIALFGKRVFASVIKLNILRSCWISLVSPKSNGKCFPKIESEDDYVR